MYLKRTKDATMGLLSVIKRNKPKTSKRLKVEVNHLTSDKTIEIMMDHILKLFSLFKQPTYRSYVVNHLLGEKKLKFDKNEVLLEDTFGKYPKTDYIIINKIIFYLISVNRIKVYKKSKRYLIELIKEDKPTNPVSWKKMFYDFERPKDINSFLDHYAIDVTPIEKKQETEKVAKLNTSDALYESLNRYRKSEASIKSVPPYIIFDNKTLSLIAKTMPTSIEGLKTIKGIGEKRIEKYGEGIVSVVNDFKANQNERLVKTSLLDDLLGNNDYISKKELHSLYKNVKEQSLRIPETHLKHFESFEALEKYRLTSNNNYLSKTLLAEEKYLDNILNQCDPNIKLDQKQREVVLRDEDYTLVVAGAGAGKTTTVAAKVKYLVDKKHVDPSKILIVSYTNDAVNELIKRVNHELNIPAIITTFHKVGYAIVRKHKNMEKFRVVHEGLMFSIIRDYMHKQMINRPDDLETLVLFFGYYLDYQLGKETIEKFRLQYTRNDYTTLKTNLLEINKTLIQEKETRKTTIQREVLRSIEEVQIANFLFLHQIDYQYETAYPYHIEGATKLYTPDFTIQYEGRKIYLEHFGIHENGTHSRYNSEEIVKYKQAMQDKIQLHKDKGSTLIYTYSQYIDKRPMLEHLKETLIKIGIQPVQRSLLDVYYVLKEDEESKYLNKFIFLIKDFIQAFKINGYTEKDFYQLESKTDNVRSRMFLKLSKPIYLHYQQFLQENDMLDFEDMINDSTHVLAEPNTKNIIPDFEYVIVDEYQDISQQRFDLTQALSKLTHAKIMAVGDDWQSIYAFAGSRIDLFINFKEQMGYADYLNIDFTYRNAQQVIDIAGNFIQKNEMQLQKHLKSPKNIVKPIVLYEYSDLAYKNEIKGIKGIIHEKAKMCQDIIGKIVQTDRKNKKIAMLARYNFEYKHFAESEFFTEKYHGNRAVLKSIEYPEVELTFMTVHASKGLGFDNVIILNGSDEVFGFPAQLEMDPLLRLVKFDDRSYSYAEERRLFYVALTRTKNRVFILYPSSKPSVFVREIATEYDLVVNHGSIDNNIPLQDRKDKTCPLCGYPLQLKKNRAYGLKLYMCTNEPELCDYLSNNLRSGKEPIRKCDKCKNGFLIVKNSRKNDNYFFGCTNYKESGTGCNNTRKIDNDAA